LERFSKASFSSTYIEQQYTSYLRGFINIPLKRAEKFHFTSVLNFCIFFFILFFPSDDSNSTFAHCCSASSLTFVFWKHRPSVLLTNESQDTGRADNALHSDTLTQPTSALICLSCQFLRHLTMLYQLKMLTIVE